MHLSPSPGPSSRPFAPPPCLQVVCDFTALAGHTLTLWNVRDDDRMDGVPFFCFSHLVMRIEARGGSSGKGGACRVRYVSQC